MKLFGITFFVILLTVFTNGLCQEKSASDQAQWTSEICLLKCLLETKIGVEYRSEWNGLLLFRGTSAAGDSRLVSRERLIDQILADEQLLGELGLSSKQQKELGSLLDSFRADLVERIRVMLSRSEKSDSSAEDQRASEDEDQDEDEDESDGLDSDFLRQRLEKFYDEIKKVVGVKGMKRLEQVGTQSALLSVPFDQLVASGVFREELRDVDLGDGLLEKARRKQAELSSGLLEFEVNAVNDYFEELISAIAEDKRDIVRGRWEKRLVRPGGLSQLYAQLDDGLREIEMPKDIWAAMCSTPGYEAGVFCEPQMMRRRDGDISNYSRLNMFRHFFLSPMMQNRFEMVESQVVGYRLLVEDFEALSREANQIVGMRHSCKINSVNRRINGVLVDIEVYELGDEQYDEYVKLLEPHALPLLERLNGLLLPHQKAALEAEALDMFSIQMGIRYDVSQGFLWDALKMSRQEVRKFESAADKIRKELRESSARCMERNIKEILDVFPEEVAKRLKDRVGVFPDFAFIGIAPVCDIWAMPTDVEVFSEGDLP